MTNREINDFMNRMAKDNKEQRQKKAIRQWNRAWMNGPSVDAIEGTDFVMKSEEVVPTKEIVCVGPQ